MLVVALIEAKESSAPVKVRQIPPASLYSTAIVVEHAAAE